MKTIIILVMIFLLSNETPGKIPITVKFILIGEAPYQKAILKQENPKLVEGNFKEYNIADHSIILDSVYKKYKDYNVNFIPIIISTFQNFQALNNVMKDTVRFPKRDILNMVISYVGNNIIYPSGYNTNTVFDSGMVLVGGGNDSCDWTLGNKLQFISPVEIQCLNQNLLPVLNYPVISMAHYLSQGYTRFKTPLLASQAFRGTPVWFSFYTQSGNFTQRYTLGRDSGEYVTTNLINISPETIDSITARVNWRSGAVVYCASDIQKIMEGRACSFREAVWHAKQTGTNNGIWNYYSGWGQINVAAAISN